ncbi:MAG TPA: GNAT family N-acetyltransferase [Firmicutes bacterium]|nr:GNAT family N-acetyltransferase [Bacillota bacterium]
MTTCLETERLLLRRFRASDWADLYRYLSDDGVVRYEPYETYTEKECRKEAAARARDRSFIAVCLKEEGGPMIGNLYFAPRPFEAFEIGFVFAARFQRQGYAYESARALMDAAFESGKARRIVAACSPLNTASWRLLEKLGLRREGHLRQNVWYKRDREGRPLWQDTYEYAILREEWAQARAAAPAAVPAGRG